MITTHASRNRRNGAVIFSERVALVNDSPNPVTGLASLDRQLSEDENRRLNAVMFSFRDLSVTRRALPVLAGRRGGHPGRQGYRSLYFRRHALCIGNASTEYGEVSVESDLIKHYFDDGLSTIARGVKSHVQGR